MKYNEYNDLDERLRAVEALLFTQEEIKLTSEQEAILKIVEFSSNYPTSFQGSISFRSFISEFFLFEFNLPRRFGKSTLANYIKNNYHSLVLKGPVTQKLKKRYITGLGSSINPYKYIVFDEILDTKDEIIDFIERLTRQNYVDSSTKFIILRTK